MREMGIDFTFVHPDDDEATLNAAFRENTKLVFAESLSNPSLVVLDIEKFAKVAHSHNVPLIVDNTFPTPVNCRPFEFGADIVVHSTTKYLDGHACAMGGVIVDSGKFDWTKGNYPGLTQPDDSYHGLIYTENFGPAAYIVKARGHLMRDIGPVASPENAFLLNHGIETVALRMERHCSNALALAKHLEKHEKINWVSFPGLPGNKYYNLAQKYMPHGTCGVISFGIAGGRANATKFMEALKLACIVTHVADNRTGLLHPASTTHRQLTDEELVRAGVGPDLIRFSCGIEHPDDIIEDVDQALKQI
jgi:O-acetylhomoserine (thiol)-lyase